MRPVRETKFIIFFPFSQTNRPPRCEVLPTLVVRLVVQTSDPRCTLYGSLYNPYNEPKSLVQRAIFVVRAKIARCTLYGLVVKQRKVQHNVHPQLRKISGIEALMLSYSS